jgi:hypothetical protein
MKLIMKKTIEQAADKYVDDKFIIPKELEDDVIICLM